MRLAAAALAVILAVGCGGGSDAEDAYRAKADRLCDRAAKAVYEVSQEGEYIPVLRGQVARLDELLRDLERLAPPESLRDDVEAYLAAARAQLRVLRQMVAAQSEQAAERIAADAGVSRLSERADELADRVGYDICS